MPASKQLTYLYDIYLKLCVQSCTPDDKWKDSLKRVEWSINSKIVHLVGFTIINITGRQGVKTVHFQPHAHHLRINMCKN